MNICITFDDISPHFLSTILFRKMIDALNNLEIKSTLFVVPFQGSYKTDFFEALDDAKYVGHEMALHGNEHSGNPYLSEFGCILPIRYPTLKMQKETIKKGIHQFKKLFNFKPLGFRAPYYLYNPYTLRALSESNFSYDSSKTVYKPCHYSPVRIRVMKKVVPFITSNIIEFPVTGDYTYNINKSNFTSCFNTALNDFNLIKKQKGLFVLNNHPNDTNIDLLLTFIKDLIDMISNQSNTTKICDNVIYYK